jgi:hypothetical protein
MEVPSLFSLYIQVASLDCLSLPVNKDLSTGLHELAQAIGLQVHLGV